MLQKGQENQNNKDQIRHLNKLDDNFKILHEQHDFQGKIREK